MEAEARHISHEWELDLGLVSRTDIVRFAGAGGDFNPIHHDEPYAQSCGYPSVFAMGMLTVSMATRLLSRRFAADKIEEFQVRFKAMVWPGERLIGRAHLRQDQDGQCVDIFIANAHGELKLTGTAILGDMSPARSSSQVMAPQVNDITVSSSDRDRHLKSRIGEIVREVRFPVEFGKVMEFRRAIRSDAVEGDKPEIPITFSVASALYAGGDATELPIKLGLDLSRTVHGEHCWTYYKPLSIGASYLGETKIHAVQRKAGRSGDMLRVVTRTNFTDEAGELVLSEDLTSIELPAA